MKKTLFILFMVMFLYVIFEVRADELKYNALEHQYEYADDNAKLEYNPFESRYEFTEENELNYNEHEHEYQYNHDDDGGDYDGHYGD